MTSKTLNTTAYMPDLYTSNGDIEGVQHFAQFGYASDLSADTLSNVWDGPTELYVFPSDTGEAMELVSTNAADNQTILVQALNAEWDQVDVPVTLNGTTPVLLSGNLARVNRLINADTTEFMGTVSLRASGGGTTYAIALPTEQISTQVVFSVPRGFKAKLETSFISLNKTGGPDVNVRFRYKRRNFGGVFATGARFGLKKNGTSAATIHIENVAPLLPKSDVMLMATASANQTDVSARLPFTLYAER